MMEKLKDYNHERWMMHKILNWELGQKYPNITYWAMCKEAVIEQ